MKFMESGCITFAGASQIHLTVLPNIDADGDAVRGRRDARRNRVGAIVIKAHAIDQRTLIDLAKKTRRFGAGLRVQSHAPDFNKTKPQRRPQFQPERVLVVARSESHGIQKFDPKHRLAKPSILHHEDALDGIPSDTAAAQRCNKVQSPLMGSFGIGPEEPGTHQHLVEHSATMANWLDACYIIVFGRY